MNKRLKASAIPLALAATLLLATTAVAQTGGSAPPSGGTTTTTPAPAPTGPPGKARLTKKGVAIPPANAPAPVVAAINAGNAIRKMPYRWGGGHASFTDTGYDCSGAVSYVLNAAGLLASPMPSGSFTTWGLPGRGRWITVFANGGHMYAVIAGLRFDTSSAGDRRRQGKGPRWRARKRKPRGYAIRYYTGY